MKTFSCIIIIVLTKFTDAGMDPEVGSKATRNLDVPVVEMLPGAVLDTPAGTNVGGTSVPENP